MIANPAGTVDRGSISEMKDGKMELEIVLVLIWA